MGTTSTANATILVCKYQSPLERALHMHKMLEEIGLGRTQLHLCHIPAKDAKIPELNHQETSDKPQLGQQDKWPEIFEKCHSHKSQEKVRECPSLKERFGRQDNSYIKKL